MRFASIRSMDISNGEGVGVALFVQGCHFHCYSCFNQETWDFNGGKEWTEDIKNKFMKLIDHPYITRVSFLGGEPLANENVEMVIKIIEEIRSKYSDKKIWLYTGYTLENIKQTLDSYTKIPDYLPLCLEPIPVDAIYDIKRWKTVKLCDVLVDGQFIDSEKDMNLRFKGSSNQRIIDVQESLKHNKVVLYYN